MDAPEHEQHHQQRVEDPLPLEPLAVVLARHAHHGADDVLPQLHEALPGPRRSGRAAGSCAKRGAADARRRPWASWPVHCPLCVSLFVSAIMLWLHAVAQSLVRTAPRATRITKPRSAVAAVRIARASRRRPPAGAFVAGSDRRVPRRFEATRGETATAAGMGQCRVRPDPARTESHAKRCAAGAGSKRHPQGEMALAWRISFSTSRATRSLP